ncbi:MAG: site-specific integrase [Nitrospirae bacterium]|nr:site-specific integrase [Nitrospirota bacterium]
MLEHWYKERRTLVDFRRGPLGSFFDGFAAHLKERGYRRYGATILGKCCLFNGYLVDAGITDCRDISETHVDAFLDQHLADFRTTSLHESTPHKCRAALAMLLAYLRRTGIVRTCAKLNGSRRGGTWDVADEHRWVIDPYVRYLREDRHLAEVTMDRHRTVCCAFLKGLGSLASSTRMKTLRMGMVEQYILAHLKGSPENRRSLTSALRAFLRFCAERSYTAEDLSTIVPSVPSYRMAALPKGMEDSALQRMLDKVPRETPTGARDYAIMLLMMAYGIRGKSAAELLLDDLNWQRSTIKIRAQKGGKEVILPLLDAVGEAILQYLRNRPATALRELFLTVKAPIAPLKSLIIARMIRNYMLRAGVHLPSRGSVTLRHSWAIRALAHDAPIKAIADVLGHRCLNTTFIYAKADLKTLKQVAMPWPERR